MRGRSRVPLLSLVILIWRISPTLSQGRIVGGTEAQPNSIPYQVSIQDLYDGFPFCSGVILDTTTILTTATCCQDKDVTELQVVAGEHNLFEESGEEQTLGVNAMKSHEGYDDFDLKDNICVMKVDDITFSSGSPATASGVVLPLSGQSFSGSATVSGWGVTSEDALEGSAVLMVATVPIVSDEECTNAYGDVITEEMICAGEEGVDSCKWDDGGPLMCSNPDDSPALCGLVSFGFGCGLDGYPGVYTEVSYYLDWIGDAVDSM